MISNDRHNEKQESPRISTDFGISMRFKPDRENAEDSIRFNCESDSNVMVSSD
jgi:hypothetical protein